MKKSLFVKIMCIMLALLMFVSVITGIVVYLI